MLTDGTHDALVIDAEPQPDGSTTVELTIVSGEHKGEVVGIRATEVPGDALDLLGIPATITVSDGTPSVSFEP